MIIIGIILSFVALAYLCWLLFVLAVYALPFFVGTRPNPDKASRPA